MSDSMNAAQIASRKIKSAKGVRGKLGNRNISIGGGLGASGPHSFTNQDASSGGGLFGGGLNASGTFNFSAPVAGISFGTTSETSTPFFGSDAEDDRRPDVTADEAERRNKPFRTVDSSAGANSQSFSNTFQRTPLSALGQPNGLGSVSEAAKPNPFEMSRSQSPAVAPFNFGATSGANSLQEKQPTGNIFSFGQTSQTAPVTNVFRFGTPPAVQDKPVGNIFPLNQPSTQAQPVSTSISFGSTTTTATNKPANAVFSFGQTSTHSQQPSSSSTGFNNNPTPSNIFANSNASKSTPTTNLFGQITQKSATVSNLFSNLSSQTATTNGTSSNQKQESATAPNSLFGGLAPSSASTSSLFGNNNHQSAPTSNIFGNLNRASPSSNNLFGSPQPEPIPSNNLFNARRELAPTSATPDVQKEQPLGNLFPTHENRLANMADTFGAQKDPAPPIGSLFGTQKEQSAPKSNLFGSQPGQPGSLFGGVNTSSKPFGSQPSSGSSIFPNQPSTSTSSIFSNQAQQSTMPTNFFANLDKPAAPASSEPVNLTTDGVSRIVNGELIDSENIGSATSFGFGLQSGGGSNKTSFFSNSASEPFLPSPSVPDAVNEPEAESVLPSIEVEGPLMDNEILTTLENGMPKQPSTSNLFSSIKPIEPPNTPAPLNPITNANVSRSSSSPSKLSSNWETAPVHGNSTSTSNELTRLQNYYSEMGEVADSVIEEKSPKHFTDAQKLQFIAAYRVRSLNKGIKLYIEGVAGGVDFSPAFHHYIQRREEILEACETGLRNLKRKHEEVQDEIEFHEPASRKWNKHSETAAIHHVPRKSSPLKTQPVLSSIHLDEPTSPEKRSSLEALQPATSPTKKVQASIIGSNTPKVPPPPHAFAPIQQHEAPPSPSPRGKRKAEVQIDKDHPTEEEAIGASHSSKLLTSNTNKPTSATSSVFKSILDSSSQPTPGSPAKKMFPLTKTRSDNKPRLNPFASLPIPPIDPKSPISTASSAQPSVSSSGTASDTLTPKPSTQASSLFQSKFIDSTSTGSPAIKPVMNPTSANLFASGASTQAASLFSLKPNSISSNISGTSIPNLFGLKAVPTASNIFSPTPSTAISSTFGTKSASSSSVPNPFAPKPAFGISTSALSSNGHTNSIKPPTFGAAPVNFLEQFGQKSKESMADAESKAMERAKEEDMDSDEDEAEWEAKYKEKRAAEKKNTEELAKNKQATYVPGKGFTFDKPQTMPDAEEKPAAKSVFSQTSAPFPSSNLFAPINRSEASSPAAVSSRASSVFDGLGPSKPATFGSHNIFGHLSDVDSGADSGKGNDADDDTSDGESGYSNIQQDEENKDPTYNPDTEEILAPSTPVEETGPGIASAKKSTAIFNFGSSISGASTPSTGGGSLFDRISKDAKGNPIRQITAEDKENARPGSASIFGVGDGDNPFAKFGPKAIAEENKTAQDNTWKPDSPIRFGASTTSPPTVNVTAPTPTKPTPFAGLFGSNAPPTPTGSPFGIFANSSAKPSSPATFNGIFGNSGTIKPGGGLFAHLSENKPASVGFGFGSATGSSLLPSSAGSTATSRATSPGGTTDGESNNENIDPEAEHHEQIDLTSGGPGEENEEILHEVRAKTLKFEPSKEAGGKNDWVVKGLGPLRVLKHKETGSSRVLLRADPSGTIVLNKGILGNVPYTATGKTVKLLTAGEGGQGLETWLLQVKSPAGAEELAGVLEANKRKD